jgi:hypothetical protein
LTIEAGRCWGVQKPEARADISAGTGKGSFVAYCTDTQAIVVEHSTSAGLTVRCTNCTQVQIELPGIPEGMYRIAEGTIVDGAFETVTDLRDFATGHRHQNGIGMNTQCAAGVCVDQVDPATVQLKHENYTPTAQVDMAAATMTRPFRMGNALAARCQTGEYFYLMSAAAGRRLYECTASNKWERAAPEAAPLKAVTYYPATALQACSPDMLFTRAASARPDLLNCGTAGLGTVPLISTAYLTTTLPPDWTAPMDARVFVVRDSHSTRVGSSKLEVALACAGSGERYAAGLFNRATSVSLPEIEGPPVTSMVFTSLDTDACSAGDLITVRLRRVRADGDARSADPLQLLGLELTLRRD